MIYNTPPDLSAFCVTVNFLLKKFNTLGVGDPNVFIEHPGGYEAVHSDGSKCLYIRSRTENPWGYALDGFRFSYKATLSEAMREEEEKRKLKIWDEGEIYPKVWQQSQSQG